MIEQTPKGWVLFGSEGRLLVPEQDDITPKLAMLFEARCEGNSVSPMVRPTPKTPTTQVVATTPVLSI